MSYIITSYSKESNHKCISCNSYEVKVFAYIKDRKKPVWCSLSGNRRTNMRCSKCYEKSQAKKNCPKFTRVVISSCKGCSKVYVAKPGRNKKFCNRECGKKYHNENRKIIHNLICKCCGSRFESSFPNKKCCSDKCDYKLKNPPLTCKTCDKLYEGSKNSSYCSNECKPSFKAFTKYNSCLSCKTPVLKPSHKCSDCLPKYVPKVPRSYECESCGKECTSHRPNAKYCGKKCNPSHKVSKKARNRGIRKAKLKVETWADIAEFLENRPEGCDLDHIIPLNHPDVCGLHNTWNFQWLNSEDNLEKSNQFDGTLENISWKIKG